MDPITLIIVCPLVFLAGVVDAIAGGGGLVSLTAYPVSYTHLTLPTTPYV